MSEHIFGQTIDEYFQQWQHIPRETETWMKSPTQRDHFGRKLIADLVKQNSKSILDVGCGIGFDYPYYKGSNVEYLGVDVTERFLQECKKRGVPAQYGNVLNLPFQDGSFDTVYCKDLLLHLPPGLWRKALAEMVRVAKKQVFTLEPKWGDETVYAIKEKHGYKETGKPVGTVFFFHNVYGMRDIVVFAVQQKLTIQKWMSKDLERTRWLGEEVNWQITLFTKEDA